MRMNVLRQLSVFAILMLGLAASPANADDVWTDLSPQYVTGIAMDSSGILYVTAQPGIEKSTDGGFTWQQVTDSADFHAGFGLAVNPVTNDLFVAVEPGVYRSSDGGTTWTKLTNAIVGTYAMAARQDGLLVATGSPGVWQSSDNGDTWTKTLNQLGALNAGIAFNQNGDIFVVTLLNGLYRSTDDGQNWQTIDSVFGDADQVQDVVTDTVNHLVYATTFHTFFQTPTYNKVFRSSDNGDTWVQIDSVQGICLSLGINSQGDVFASRIPTAYTTDQGASWIDISSGVQQGNRLKDYLEIAPGRMLLADFDGALKMADFGPVPPCCVGQTGNVDNDPTDAVTLTDLTALVNHLFVSFEPLACPGEANTNGDVACAVTLSDLTVLVNHLFVTFEPTAPCSSACE